MQVAGSDAGGSGHFLDVLADMPWRYLRQLAAAVLPGPFEKQLHGVAIGPPRVLVANHAGEEFLRSEDRIGTGAVDDVGQLVRDE